MGMTEQEAEKVIRALTFTIVRREKIPKDKIKMVLEALGNGIDALLKQIAKKPYIEENVDAFRLYHCPNCKMPIFAGTNHCSDCGQKLDWGSEDAE